MEPLIHAIIPVIFLLAFFPKLKLKHIMALLPIVWFVDLDTFVDVHRFTFHNIFFVLFLALIVLIVWNKRAFLVALFYGFSHLLLDLTEPGAALFYPLYQKTIYFTTIISVNPNILHFSIETMTVREYQLFIQTLAYPHYFTEFSLIFILFLIIVLILKKLKFIF
jgi:hypothetical protein